MVLETMVPRRISACLRALVSVEPVIALHGPRSVGKSTVLRRFAEEMGLGVVDLDDVEAREAVTGNLGAVVAGASPLCVDEYQRVPEILDAIKSRLNREGSLPGTAVITGSTRHDAVPSTAQTLTGRLHTLTIWPLSQGELGGVREDLIERLLAHPESAVAACPTSGTTRPDYAERVCAGGLPLALRRTGAARSRWFDDFVRSSVERDALELAQVRQKQALRDLLAHLAAQTGQILNISTSADAVGVSRGTVEGHLRLLEDLFLVVRVPAWGKSGRSRASGRPKVHVVDSGLAARLVRVTPERLATLDPAALTEFGHLLETFVVGEIRKQVSWSDEPVTLGHWRSKAGHEVDLVLESDDGRIIGVEVKASQRAASGDFNGLKQLRALAGARFAAGIVFTTGSRSYTYDDRLHVLPVDRLWTPITSQ